jgi:hypothetical protein
MYHAIKTYGKVCVFVCVCILKTLHYKDLSDQLHATAASPPAKNLQLGIR